MRYEKLIVIMLIVSFFVFVSVARAAGKPGDSQMLVTYHLLVEKKVNSQTGAIDCRLRVENKTDKLQFVSRPVEKDISLSVKGLDKGRYSVTFEERGFESLAKREIPLRPTCAIEMKLGKIVFRRPEGGEFAIPQGNYSIAASWKRPGLPDVKTGNFEVVDEYVPPITRVQATSDEYPLDIVLEPSSKTYNLGDRILLSVRLQNNGALPVSLMNYFHPYKNHFRFEKKDAASGRKLEGYMGPGALISPRAIEGWITLLPGECLSTTINASDEFKSPNEYRVAVTYFRTILIYPKDGKPKDPIYPSLGLIFPPDGKPYYTKQHNWTSNEVDIAILEADKKEKIEGVK